MRPYVSDFERPAEAGNRVGHVTDRIRRAVLPHDVCGQADGRAQPDAGDRTGVVNIEPQHRSEEIRIESEP